MAHSVPPASVRLVRVHGAEVRVSVRGEGPALLMFMGIGAPASSCGSRSNGRCVRTAVS